MRCLFRDMLGLNEKRDDINTDSWVVLGNFGAS